MSADGRLTPCIAYFPLAEHPTAHVIMPVSMGYRTIGSDLDDTFAADKSLERKFYATHLLMQQTIAWVESQPPPRPFRRRVARGGLPVSNIIVVKLRKMEKAPESESGDLVAWTHRWLVNGHWRQQWYPSTREHRPIWISPHVKGPESKPLVVKEKVTAWVR